MKTLLLATFFTLIFGGTITAQMTIHHINVQQGDATLIEFRTAAILVDAGGSTKTAKKHFFDYLDKFFQRRADLNRTLYSVIITHPHKDHLQWLEDVLEKYTVLNLVDNGDERDKVGSEKNGSIGRMKDSRRLFNKQANANPGKRSYDGINSSKITSKGLMTPWFKNLQAREPLAKVVYLASSRTCDNPNNGSVVVRFSYGRTSILVTGDAEDEHDGGCVPTIPRMLSDLAPGELDVDIYKAGHHSSPNGTNQPYLQKMTPEISVISAGDQTDGTAKGYGHPRVATINLIAGRTSRSRDQARSIFGRTASRRDRGVIETFTISEAVYCTCWDGDIRISTDEDGNLSRVTTSK